ncbi:MAG: site-specific integrase, partial [Nitrososphaeria archaeon]|nr:site-specific integrase [Nitrososphaeria archaeon]
IRVAIRKAGFPWRPYVLRSYFDTQLMLAESKGLVLRDYRQFWMGHKGDIENRYTTNKQRLPEEVVEDMREAYRRSQDYLQTTM